MSRSFPLSPVLTRVYSATRYQHPAPSSLRPRTRVPRPHSNRVQPAPRQATTAPTVVFDLRDIQQRSAAQHVRAPPGPPEVAAKIMGHKAGVDLHNLARKAGQDAARHMKVFRQAGR